MDTFPCLSATRWTEVYECAVHVGQQHRALSTSQSGQASSILVSSEWQIGCHKPGLIAACCSLRKSFQAKGGMETKPCRYKQCVWDTVSWATLWDGILYMFAPVLHRIDSFIYYSCQSE